MERLLFATQLLAALAAADAAQRSAAQFMSGNIGRARWSLAVAVFTALVAVMP